MIKIKQIRFKGRGALKLGLGGSGEDVPAYQGKSAVEVSQMLRELNASDAIVEGVKPKMFNELFYDVAFKPVYDLGRAMRGQINPAGHARNDQATQNLLAIWRGVLSALVARERHETQVPELPVEAICQTLAQGADPNALTADDLDAYETHFKLLGMLTIDGPFLPNTLSICTALINAGWVYPVDFMESALNAAFQFDLAVADLSDAAHARWTAEDRASRAGTVTGGSTRQRSRA